MAYASRRRQSAEAGATKPDVPKYTKGQIASLPRAGGGGVGTMAVQPKQLDDVTPKKLDDAPSTPTLRSLDNGPSPKTLGPSAQPKQLGDDQTYQRGGGVKGMKKPQTDDDAAEKEFKESRRKKGGMVPGNVTTGRPDRRARGGAVGDPTSDKTSSNPWSTSSGADKG